MAIYITLGKWTDKGIQSAKEAPKREQAAEEMAKQLGGKIYGFYITMGKYDFVAVSDFPDDEAIMRFSLGIGGQGNVRTTTMKAWTIADAAKVIGKL